MFNRFDLGGGVEGWGSGGVEGWRVEGVEGWRSGVRDLVQRYVQCVGNRISSPYWGAIDWAGTD